MKFQVLFLNPWVIVPYGRTGCFRRMEYSLIVRFLVLLDNQRTTLPRRFRGVLAKPKSGILH